MSNDTVTCPRCHGEKTVSCAAMPADWREAQGLAASDRQRCNRCNATGVIFKRHAEEFTIKAAKEAAKRLHGRLPRCGYEMVIDQGEAYGEIRDLDGRTIRGHFDYRTYLQNNAGRFRVWTWRAAFPNC